MFNPYVNITLPPRVTPPPGRGQELGMESDHPSFARLMHAANVGSGKPVSKSALARLLGVSPQTVTNWKERGVSRDGALFAQDKFGFSATWILNGTGDPTAIDRGATGAPSQAARLDPDVLRIAAQTARAIAARAIDPEQDAELLAKAYDAIVELAGSQPPPAVIVDLLDWYRGRGGASGLSGEGATGGAGPAAGGKPARKASA